MTDTESLAELAERLYNMPGTATHEEMAKLAPQWMTDGIELHYPGSAPIPFARVWKGREGFSEFLKSFFGSVEVIEMPAATFLGVGQRVFVQGSTLARVRATGKTYRSNWLLVWTFEGRKLAKMVEYHDTQAMAEAFR